jgi:hypothetical protein
MPLCEEPNRLSRTFSSWGAAMPTGIMTAATKPTAASARQRHARATASTTPATSAAKLDCEKETKSPTHTASRIAPSPSSSSSFRSA